MDAEFSLCQETDEKNSENKLDEFLTTEDYLVASLSQNDVIKGDLSVRHRQVLIRRPSKEINDEGVVEIEEDDLDIKFSVSGVESDEAEEVLHKVLEASWNAMHFHSLPEWLQDNNFLHTGHRPPMPSFKACFESIFRLHSETGNIWTHMLGCLLFTGMTFDFMTRSMHPVQWIDKMAIAPCILGAVLCTGMSFVYHTVGCHSNRILKLFSKFDYIGICLLNIGSWGSWTYYAFYCRREPQVAYVAMLIILGTPCIILASWDKFAEPRFRPYRAAVFTAFGASGLVPVFHYIIDYGYASAVNEASVNWIWLTISLYGGGALLYGARIPERFFPGKCDIWPQGHQVLHLCVIGAAFSHFHGVTLMAVKRVSTANCEDPMQLFQ